MTSQERSYGPQPGSPIYEKLRGEYTPMNPPSDVWALDHFVIPMPDQEVNLPPVASEVTWVEGAPLSLEGRTITEHFVSVFFARATIQGVARDVNQVEIYRMAPHHEGDVHGVFVQPVVRGRQFENEFERQIYQHKFQRSLGTALQRPRNLVATAVSEDHFPTFEARIGRFQVQAELLAIAHLKQAPGNS